MNKLDEEILKVLNEGTSLTKKDIAKIFDKLGYYYVGLDNKERTIVRIDRETIPDMPQLFEDDLKNSNTYGYYYPVPKYAVDNNKIMTYLPIYGNANHYVTKWLKPSIDAALQMDIRDIGLDEFNLASKNFEALGINSSEMIDDESNRLALKDYKYFVQKTYNIDHWKDEKAGDKSYSAVSDNPLELDTGVYDYLIKLNPSKDYTFVVDMYVKDYFTNTKIKDWHDPKNYEFHITQTFGDNGQFKLPDISINDLEGDKGLDFRKEIRKDYKSQINKFYGDK